MGMREAQRLELEVNLKDLKHPIPEAFRKSLAAQLLDELRGEAKNRAHSVARGAETAELAATMLGQIGWGFLRAAQIIGIDVPLQAELNRLVHDIDPDFEAHTIARWSARPASLALQTTDGLRADDVAQAAANTLLSRLREL